jgi:hypothetical protein
MMLAKITGSVPKTEFHILVVNRHYLHMVFEHWTAQLERVSLFDTPVGSLTGLSVSTEDR